MRVINKATVSIEFLQFDFVWCHNSQHHTTCCATVSFSQLGEASRETFSII